MAKDQNLKTSASRAFMIKVLNELFSPEGGERGPNRLLDFVEKLAHIHDLKDQNPGREASESV